MQEIKELCRPQGVKSPAVPGIYHETQIIVQEFYVKALKKELRAISRLRNREDPRRKEMPITNIKSIKKRHTVASDENLSNPL